MALKSSSIRKMAYLYFLYIYLPYKQKIDFYLPRSMEEISSHHPSFFFNDSQCFARWVHYK